MSAFDAPNREVCSIRRNRTNTPMQALVTLNDPVFVEAAQALGRMTLKRTVRSGTAFASLSRCLIREPGLRRLTAWLPCTKRSNGIT